MTTGFKIRDLSYIDLIAQFPPRQISNETELLATYAQIKNVLEEKLTVDSKEYLKILCNLAYDYEEISEPIPELKGRELVKALLEEDNIPFENLIPIFKNESELLNYLEGKQDLNQEQIKKLANFFDICEEELKTIE